VALFACISVLIIGLFACDDQKDGSSAHSGKLRLSLTADTTSLKKGVNSNLTKAVSDEFEKFLTVEDYQIRIVTDKDTVKSYDRFDKMPSEIELPEGAYTIVASKGTDLPAAFENPYFEGSTAFTIKEDMSTPLDMTCTLGNARITAEYTDDFKEAYSDYTVLLSSSFATTEFEIAKGETRPAYLQVAKEGTDVAIGIRLKKINAEEEKTYYVPTALKLERRQNVRLVFKTDGEALEGIGLEVVLDDAMEEMTFTTEIPDFMWQQFTKPTLVADGFEDGDEFTVKTSTFSSDLSVGFGMPGGIGHLYVKCWAEDVDEEEATLFDLATKEGVEAALKNNLSWEVNGDKNLNLSEVRKTGVLYLKEAIRNLKAPEEGTTTYTYHFYGTDATGKEQATTPYPLVLKIKVQAGNLPIVDFAGFPEAEIVEGNTLSKESVAVVTMEGGINKSETKLVVGHDNTNQEYPFTEDGITKLEKDYDIQLKVENTSATVTFPKTFTERLVASEIGYTDYKFSFKLKDENNKVSESQKPYVIRINAPDFDFLTDEGAAFAKRIVLRTDLRSGDPSKLRYQYRTHDASEWINVGAITLKPETSGSTIYKYTLDGLEFNTEYDLAVIYNDKYRKETTVRTEDPVYNIPNAGFEEYSSEMVWEKTIFLSGGLKIYAFYPYLNSGDKWWNTSNRTTTQSVGDASWYYCAFSGVVPIKELTYAATSHLNNYGGQSLGISAHGGENAMEISTVGWGGNNWTSQSSAQNDVDYRTAGMLYIGDYDLTNHKESLGKSFSTRPSGVKFYYKFYSYNNETTKAYAQLWDEDGSSIGYGELKIKTATDEYMEGVIPIDYTVMKKAAKMTVVFLSTDVSQPATLAIQGSLGPVGEGYGDSRHIGSVLTVDDVSLIYE
jgi:hypothetical protein